MVIAITEVTAALTTQLTTPRGAGLRIHTAKIQNQKFEINIPRKGIARPQSQFPHAYVCERFIYSHNLSAFSAAGHMTHEYGNWD